MDLSFYDGKRVFITGHNGFKGTWLCRVLDILGADVFGYSLPANDAGWMSEIIGLDGTVPSVKADIRDLDALRNSMTAFEPDVVIHLAAQPIVRESYADPVNTYDINVMGTVNVLESVRSCKTVKSVINVTTDKVYRNYEKDRGYTEDDILDGYDPYANSKSCSELVTASYRRSFFADRDVSVTTCRAGNVIGGGDYAKDRIIPDCVRAATDKRTIVVRNPGSVRPYQHVLEPVCAYLTVAAEQFCDSGFEGTYNIGPDDCDCVTTRDLVGAFCREWGDAVWESHECADAPHESGLLRLDCSKISKIMGWHPHWHIDEAVRKTVEWYKAFNAGDDMSAFTDSQIRDYLR